MNKKLYSNNSREKYMALNFALDIFYQGEGNNNGKK